MLSSLRCDSDHASRVYGVCVCVQLAFLMEHVEIKDNAAIQTKQLKCMLRCEVPGFEHNTPWDNPEAHSAVEMQEG